MSRHKYLIIVLLCLAISIICIVGVWWYYDRQLATLEHGLMSMAQNVIK